MRPFLSWKAIFFWVLWAPYERVRREELVFKKISLSPLSEEQAAAADCNTRTEAAAGEETDGGFGDRSRIDNRTSAP